MNEFAQYPYFLEQVRAYQELFAAGAGLVEIDGRIYALLGQAAFKMNLGIAGAFEFFVYDFVHATAGFAARRADNGQRAAIFQVSCRAKKQLWALQRLWGDADGNAVS